jgi:hypothetical protein
MTSAEEIKLKAWRIDMGRLKARKPPMANNSES